MALENAAMPQTMDAAHTLEDTAEQASLTPTPGIIPASAQGPQGGAAPVQETLDDKGADTDIDDLQDVLGDDEDELGPIPAAGAPRKPTFAELMAQSADQIGVPAGPGGWAKTLVGSAQQALAGAGAVGKVPEGAGALYGLGKAMQYRQQMQQQQQARQDQLAQQARENARQDAESQAKQEKLNWQTRMIQANIQKMHNERMAHQLTDLNASMDHQIQTDAPVLDSLIGKDNAHPAQIVAQGVDKDEVHKLLADKKINSFEHHAFATQKIPVLDAEGQQAIKDGVPQFKMLYTVVGDSPKVTVGDQEAGYLSKYTDDKWDPKISLSSDQLYLAHQRAAAVDLALQHINESRTGMGIPELTPDMIQKKSDMHDVGEALRVTNYDPILAKQYLDVLKKDPEGAIQLQALYGGTKAWQQIINSSGLVKQKEGGEPKTVEEAAINLSKAQMDLKDDPKNPDKQKAVAYAQAELTGANDEAKKIADQKKSEDKNTIPGNTNLSGMAYLNSVDPAEKALMVELGTGKIAINNMGYILARNPGLVAGTALAFPGFDSSKIGGYPTLVKDFNTGASSDTIQAANTFLPHLENLYTHLKEAQKMGGILGPGGFLSGAWAAAPGVAGTKAGQLAAQIQTDQQTAVRELEATYSKYALSPSEKDAYTAMLQSANPETIINKIPEIAHLMQDRMDAIQEKWNDGAPSDQYKPPRQILDDKARQSLVNIIGGEAHFRPLMTTAPPTQTPPSPPTPQTHTFSKSAYLKANPQGDVNAAAQAATSAGYQVTQ